MNEIKHLLKDVQNKLTLEGKKKVFEENKELKSDDLEKWQDAEEFTREYLIDKILFDILKVSRTGPKNFETTDGTPRKVDYAIKYEKNRVILEVKPINANLYEKSAHGAINQIKGVFRLAEARDKYNFGIATDGLKWFFINKEGKIIDELDLRENFENIKRYIVGEEKIRERKLEDISKKFYEEYNDLLHGIKRISKNDCLVNSIEHVENEDDREEIAQVIIDRLIFIKFLQSKGIIKDDVLDFLYRLEEYELNLKLNQLFFEIMNTKERERGSVDPHFAHIPYLNGSLFERLDVEKRNPSYRIRARILRRVIEFLNKFRFIHRESLENQEDVIDPEILGYIFERAMTATDRKGTGAYYTPKEITKYIAENTIYPAIIKKTNEFLLKEKECTKKQLPKKIDDLFILFPTTLNKIWNKIILNLIICDDACGSGAFLLAAANILFEINKRINDRLGLNNSDVALKKLVLKSLYGVDINPRAIEIAMLRLWLWLVESYKSEDIEPLPNIEYNLRVGNSLIGYVDIEQFGITKVTLDDFVGTEETTKLLLNEFRDLKIKYRKAVGEEARQLRKEIEEIRDKIKRKLDKELYQDIRGKKVEISKEEFLNLKPFHWGFEFYEVFDLDKTTDERGFDVAIGNPPYVELNKVEYGYLFTKSKNLYDEFMKISIKKLLSSCGMFGFIHANSAYCQPKYKALRNFLREYTDDLTIINFAIRPQPVFKGVMQRTAITICKCKKNISGAESVKTSRYLRLTEETRNKILSEPPIYDCSEFAWDFDDFIPKIGNEEDYRIFKKAVSCQKSLGNLLNLNGKKGVSLFYHDSGESYWTKLLTYEPKGIRDGQEVRASQWFEIKVNRDYADFVTCAVNSTLFYWFWLTISDCRHLTQKVLKQFPIPSSGTFSSDILKELKRYSQKLMKCYKDNSCFVEKRKRYKSLEFKVNRCKKLINEIDRLIGRIYGLTDKEIEYLIGYDLEMRTEKD